MSRKMHANDSTEGNAPAIQEPAVDQAAAGDVTEGAAEAVAEETTGATTEETE